MSGAWNNSLHGERPKTMKWQAIADGVSAIVARCGSARRTLASRVADATKDALLLRLLVAFPVVVVLAIAAMISAFEIGTVQLDAAFDKFIAANEVDELIDHTSLQFTIIQLLGDAARTDVPLRQRWRREAAEAERNFRVMMRETRTADGRTLALGDIAASFARYRTTLGRYLDGTTAAGTATQRALFDQANANLTSALTELSRAKTEAQDKINAASTAYTAGRARIRTTIFSAIILAFGAAAVACGLLLMRLLALLREAEAVSRTRGEFLSMMGHELRTPLNAVIGFGQLIEREAFGPLGSHRYKVYMRLINGAAQDLLTFVNNLLDLSSVDTKARVVPVVVTAGALVDSALMFLSSLREKLPIAITQTIDARASVCVDPAMITKALIAIIGNAIKFNTDNGAVNISAQPTAAGWITITVQDTGVGIPANLLSKITDPFFQVGHGHTRRFDGGGIGLSVAHQLIVLNRGELTITSELDKGTVVTLRLPAASAAKAAA